MAALEREMTPDRYKRLVETATILKHEYNMQPPIANLACSLAICLKVTSEEVIPDQLGHFALAEHLKNDVQLLEFHLKHQKETMAEFHLDFESYMNLVTE